MMHLCDNIDLEVRIYEFHGERSNSKDSIHRSRGFTIIEVLVVITVIGILVALLLPALQQASEASRNIQCRNNLKQIGLALNQYETTFYAYPFGVGGGGPPGGEPRWSAQSQILAYMDQRLVFDAMNFSGVPWLHDPVYSPMNRTALKTEISTYLCPSDATFPRDPLGMAANSYRACAGTLPMNLEKDYTTPTRKGKNNGVFWYQSAVRQAEIRDGLSNTAFFSERCIGTYQMSDPLSGYYKARNSINACISASLPGVRFFQDQFELSGERWGDGDDFYTRYHHILPPQSNSCLLGCAQDYGCPNVITATSRHRSGVNILLGDGSVRFVNRSVSATIWTALGTINGREVIDSTGF
jgi:prepilin-type N-terminal cleavage/methylation domain-containing protein/prepilin-type processing-associated H-X9-DG protein